MRHVIALWLGALLAATVVACADDDDSGEEPDAAVDGGDSDSDTDSDGDTDLDCSEENQWWIWDLSVMPPTDTLICATEQGTGENVHVVVEDDAWENGDVTSEMIDNLIAAWDDATPSDSGAGIFDQVTGLFGDPPDAFDDDPKIYLLLYVMEGYMGTSFDGYFKNTDQTGAPTSNRHEMLHINVDAHAPDTDYSLSVQAHEFQHLIHYGLDPAEDQWINEALSEVAMVLTGFGADEDWVESWLNDPTDPLMADGPDYNYGVLLLFGTYLWEQFGDAFITDLASDTAHGLDALEPLITAADDAADFSSVLGDFALAVALDDPAFAEGEFGFDALELIAVDATLLEQSAAEEVAVPGDGGLAFIHSFDDADGLTLRLETDAADVLEVRVATATSSGGQTLLTDLLDGATTDVSIGSWPAGTSLWVTVANSSASAATITASLF